VSVQISAVIITFNEEENIEDAIRSLDWADEVLVIDSDSSDRTCDLARSLGARVLTNPWPGFSDQKQLGVENSANDWIFSLDADERVSDELRKEIESIRSNGASADGYRIPRLSFYVGRPIRHGGWYPDHQLRLFDRRKGRWNGAVIHESVKLDDNARVSELRGEILHYTVKSAEEHNRMIAERYAPLGAQKMYDDGRRTSPVKAVFAGWFAFIRAYFLKLGFLDGYAGFCIAYFAAHHAFMKHTILLELQSDSEQRGA
jgi:glycosyltransferase involved in cell wall biosynthesis